MPGNENCKVIFKIPGEFLLTEMIYFGWWIFYNGDFKKIAVTLRGYHTPYRVGNNLEIWNSQILNIILQKLVSALIR